MIVLAVDAGNTRIKWGLHDGAAWTARGAATHGERSALERDWAPLAAPQRIAVSNVAGPETGAFLRERLARWGAESCWIRSLPQQGGVRNGYRDPSQLGCDRWAALIAARRRVSGPCLVVNAGTAMTVDALAADGLFLGGIIVPGAGLMKRALAGSTAALDEAAGLFEDFPRSTADAMVSGSIQALGGAVERMARLLRERAGAEPRCILSGGAAPLLAPRLGLPLEVADNLVLEGLLIIAHEPDTA
ncbi:MAG TPA: type III pantothenate kinase [Burkholderiales bacterium]|nr:type III pantothenate kinase [Burkholderiales bacterium]